MRALYLPIFNVFFFFFSEISDLKVRVKESLSRSLRDSLKHDWLEEGLNFPLMKYYTDLVWKRKVKDAMGKVTKSMKGMEEVLQIDGAGIRGRNILVEGERLGVLFTHNCYVPMRGYGDSP